MATFIPALLNMSIVRAASSARRSSTPVIDKSCKSLCNDAMHSSILSVRLWVDCRAALYSS